MVCKIQDYSCIQHLARSLFLGHDWRKCFLAMYTAYFDASGTLGEPVMAVAGYVTTVEHWEKFDCGWRIALAHDNVAYFHMKEFAGCRGAFKNWSADQVSRRTNLLKRLVDVVRVACGCGLSTLSAVRKADFETVNQKFCLQETFGNPYSLCGVACALKAEQWKAQTSRTEPSEYVFEHGDKGWMELKTAFDKYDLPIPIQKKKRNRNNPNGPTPLEAADFAAWEMRKAIATIEEKKLRGVAELRRPLHALRAVQNRAWGVLTLARLTQFCKEHGVPAR